MRKIVHGKVLFFCCDNFGSINFGIVCLDVGKFEAKMLLFVDYLKPDTNKQCCDTQACEHHERPSVIVANGCLGFCQSAVGKTFSYLRICIVEYFTN